MHDPTLREEMEDFYTYLQHLIIADKLSIPSKDYDLVLDIMVTDDERISWSYYYACHESRCLFWLETYDASYMISELFGVKSPAHVSTLELSHSSFPRFPLILCAEHRLESLYWRVGYMLLDWFLTTDIVWIGLTGHFFQPFLRVVVFHLMRLMSSWES